MPALIPKAALISLSPEILSQRLFIHGTGQLAKAVSNIRNTNPIPAIITGIKYNSDVLHLIADTPFPLINLIELIVKLILLKILIIDGKNKAKSNPNEMIVLVKLHFTKTIMITI